MSASPNRPLPVPVGLSYERRLLLDAGLLLLPLAGLCALLVWLRPGPSLGLWVGFAVVALFTLVLLMRLRQRAVFPLYTLSNLLEALREGDYSLRGSRARRGDAIGDVIWEVNALSRTLREQRLQVEETSALLGKIIAAIDIALLTFDDRGRLQLLNPAAERLLGRRAAEALGENAASLGLQLALEGGAAGVSGQVFPGASGRFDVRQFAFRQGGLPFSLLVITDLSRALREEERQAWQRLIRVLGHELNNSLAPIKSMSETLSSMLAQVPPPDDWQDDAHAGLKVIGDRADALSRFMLGYATLARLPSPDRRRLELQPLLARAAALEQAADVWLEDVEPLTLLADPDQLEQALINLLRNAVEAGQKNGGGVRVRAHRDGDQAVIDIVDEGTGLPQSDNLFVPFFTTKPGGSGIGLVLARQIVEGHGGSLSLQNREDRSGCIARLRIPLDIR